MAPGLTSVETVTPINIHKIEPQAPQAISTHGSKTSGQHPPNYDELRPYEDFPEAIEGPTLWKAEDHRDNPERWVHRFSQEEIEEMSTAADNFKAAGTPLTEISRDAFPLPRLSNYLFSIRHKLLNEKGFVLFKGFPVEDWGNEKSAIAYMGLGTYLGNFVSQNGRGHILGHVKDLGEDAKQTDKVRIYRTNARQFFHTDPSDIVGLLCIARALEGGESDITSLHNVYNTLRAERPDVLRLLTEPIWYFDRKGEVSKGEEPYIRTSILYLEPKENGRVYCKFDPYYIRSLTRFSSAGVIPPLSVAQDEAVTIMEETCHRLALHMVLEVGDIQFLSNSQVLHARTAYKDHAPPAPRRHLMRLWLAVPEGEGGWKLPFWDSKWRKRGGVQVGDVAEVARVDAD